MNAGLVSLDQVWENKALNMEKCRIYARLASEAGCKILIFPEMTLTGFTMNSEFNAETRSNSQTISFFSSIAKKLEMCLLFGMIIENNPLPLNYAFSVGSGGEILGEYAKIHPFSYSGEDRYYTAGSDPAIFGFDGFKFGMTICYDLRFPELYQALSLSAGIIINIASWPESRAEHWGILLKARAIENQIFMIGVNRSGMDGNGIFYRKNSMVIDPFGIELNPVMSEKELDIYDIDLSLIEYYRTRFPFRLDRKTGLYKKII